MAENTPRLGQTYDADEILKEYDNTLAQYRSPKAAPAPEIDTSNDKFSILGGRDSSRLGGLVGSFVEGAATGIAAVPESIEEIGVGIYNKISGGNTSPDDVFTPMDVVSTLIKEGLGTIARPNPANAEGIPEAIAGGLGSVASYLLPGAAVKALGVGKTGQRVAQAATAMSGTGMEGVRDYEATMASQGREADASDRFNTFLGNAGIGLTEMIPINRAFDRLEKAGVGNLRRTFGEILKGGAEEYLQEGLQNTLSNLVASDLVAYDPDRGMFEDTAKSAAIGGGVGLIYNTLIAIAGGKKRGDLLAREANARQLGDMERAAANPANQLKQSAEAIKAATEQEAATNPATGEPLLTPKMKNFNRFLIQARKLRAQETDTESANYKNYDLAVKNIERQLDAIINPKEGKEVDPVAQKEAKDILERIKQETPTPEATPEAPAEQDTVVPTEQTIADKAEEDVTISKEVDKAIEEIAPREDLAVDEELDDADRAEIARLAAQNDQVVAPIVSDVAAENNIDLPQSDYPTVTPEDAEAVTIQEPDATDTVLEGGRTEQEINDIWVKVKAKNPTLADTMMAELYPEFYGKFISNNEVVNEEEAAIETPVEPNTDVESQVVPQEETIPPVADEQVDTRTAEESAADKIDYDQAVQSEIANSLTNPEGNPDLAMTRRMYGNIDVALKTFMSENDMYGPKTSNTFKSAGAAKAGLKRSGKADTHEVLDVGGEFILAPKDRYSSSTEVADEQVVPESVPFNRTPEQQAEDEALSIQHEKNSIANWKEDYKAGYAGQSAIRFESANYFDKAMKELGVEVIKTSDNKPFKSVESAQRVLKSKGLEGTHEVVKYRDGAVIIPVPTEVTSQEDISDLEDKYSDENLPSNLRTQEGVPSGKPTGAITQPQQGLYAGDSNAPIVSKPPGLYRDADNKTPSTTEDITIGQTVLDENQVFDAADPTKQSDIQHWSSEKFLRPDFINTVSAAYANGIPTIARHQMDTLPQALGAMFNGGVFVKDGLKGFKQAHVIAHELGHLAHFNNEAAINENPTILAELEAIAPVLYPNIADLRSHNSYGYIASANELVAEFNAYRFAFPAKAKATAPTLYKVLQDAESTTIADASVRLAEKNGTITTLAPLSPVESVPTPTTTTSTTSPSTVLPTATVEDATDLLTGDVQKSDNRIRVNQSDNDVTARVLAGTTTPADRQTSIYERKLATDTKGMTDASVARFHLHNPNGLNAEYLKLSGEIANIATFDRNDPKVIELRKYWNKHSDLFRKYRESRDSGNHLAYVEALKEHIAKMKELKALSVTPTIESDVVPTIVEDVPVVESDTLTVMGPPSPKETIEWELTSEDGSYAQASEAVSRAIESGIKPHTIEQEANVTFTRFTNKENYSSVTESEAANIEAIRTDALNLIDAVKRLTGESNTVEVEDISKIDTLDAAIEAKLIRPDQDLTPEQTSAIIENVVNSIEDINEQIEALNAVVEEKLRILDETGTRAAEAAYNAARKKRNQLQQKAAKLANKAGDDIDGTNILEQVNGPTDLGPRRPSWLGTPPKVKISESTDIQGTKVYKHDAVAMKLINDTISRFNEGAKKFGGSVVGVKNYTELPMHLRAKLLLTAQKRKGSPFSTNALFDPETNTSYVMTSALPNAYQVEVSLLHEVVGHFGLRKAFEAASGGDSSSYTTFVEKEGIRNPKLMQEAASLIIGRKGYTKFGSTSKQANTALIVSVNGKPYYLSKEDAGSVLDEFIAFNTEQLLSDQDYNTKYGSFRARLVAALRHMFRKLGFGAKELTMEDIHSLISESHRRIFDLENKSAVGFLQGGTQGKGPRYRLSRLTDPASRFYNRYAAELHGTAPIGSFVEEEIATAERLSVKTPVQRELIEQIEAEHEDGFKVAIRLSKEGVGKIGPSSVLDRWSNQIDAWKTALESKPLFKQLKRLAPMHNLPDKQIYQDIGSETRGMIAKGENVTKRLEKIFKKTTKLQNIAIRDYFTTAGAEVSLIPGLTTQQLEDVADAKLYLEQLGDQLVGLNILSEESQDRNRGSYLPRVYYKYMQYANLPSGKKRSFMGYLRHQRELPLEQRTELGELADASLVIPSTIGTIARDIALTHMTNRIIEFSASESLAWVLGDKHKVSIISAGGKKQSVNIYQLEEMVKILREQAAEGAEGPTFGRSETQHLNLINRINYIDAKIKTAELMRIQEIKDLIIAENGSSHDEINDDMVEAYLTSNYKKMPSERAYGALAGKLVMKPIYEDFVTSIDVVDNEEMGATWDRRLQTGHQYWKASKVVLNVPVSSIRNGIGNGVLLDLSTNTNSPKLIKMVIEEFSGMFMDTRDSSRFWKYANEMGMEGTTYSSAELNLIQRTLQKDLKLAAGLKRLKEGSLEHTVKSGLIQGWGGITTVFSAAAKFYGLQEGLFKVVKMRDHIEHWETQNNIRLDDTSMDPNVRKAVLLEAAREANKAIFDYDDVPGWVRWARRYPIIGSPFVTFTYKSMLAMPENFAKHPQKFIKYQVATSTALMSVLGAYADWDDDEAEEVMKALPYYYENSSSIFLVPWKDGNGRPQIVDLSVYIPYAPHINMLKGVAAGMEKGDVFAAKDALLSWSGAVGAPAANLIAATLSGNDPFSGRQIVPDGASGSERLSAVGIYLYGLAMPPVLTQSGGLGHLLDNAGIPLPPFSRGQELNRLGEDKETFGQAAGRVFGINAIPQDNRLARSNLQYSYEADIRKLTTRRGQVIRDQNLNAVDKAASLRGINERIKQVRTRYRDRLQ